METRTLKIPLNRPDGIPDASLKGRIRKCWIGNYESGSRRRIRHGHNQVLLVCRVEIKTVTDAQRCRPITQQVPGQSETWRNVLKSRVLVELSPSGR